MTTTQVRLAAGDTTVVVDPMAGGRLTSYVVGTHELLVPHGSDDFHWGSFPMAPWVGRLRDGRFRFDGEVVQLPVNAGRHALHGLVTGVPWTVTDTDARSVALAVDLGRADSEPWPWPCRVIQAVSLSHDRVDFRLEVQAERPMPADIGWHPWFNRTLASSAGQVSAELDISSNRIYLDDSDGLPSGELGPPPPPPWDYCFVGLQRSPTVRWPGLLELTVDSDCDHWVVYDMEPAGVCVEPWTGPPDSLNGPAQHVVTPDRPLTATMSWVVRRLRP